MTQTSVINGIITQKHTKRQKRTRALRNCTCNAQWRALGAPEPNKQTTKHTHKQTNRQAHTHTSGLESVGHSRLLYRLGPVNQMSQERHRSRYETWRTHAKRKQLQPAVGASLHKDEIGLEAMVRARALGPWRC